MPNDWIDLVPSSLSGAVDGLVGGLVGGGFAVLAMAIEGRRQRQRDRDERTRENLRNLEKVLWEISEMTHDYGQENFLPDDLHRRREELIDRLNSYVAHVEKPVAAADLLRELRGIIADPMYVRNSHWHFCGAVVKETCDYALQIVSSVLLDKSVPTDFRFLSEYRKAIADTQEEIDGTRAVGE